MSRTTCEELAVVRRRETPNSLIQRGVVTAWVPNRRSVIQSREDWQPIRASTYNMYKHPH